MKTPLVDQNVVSRNYWVDMLRGTAILAVMFLHFHIAYHLDTSALNKIFTVDFIKSVFSNGNYGKYCCWPFINGVFGGNFFN